MSNSYAQWDDGPYQEPPLTADISGKLTMIGLGGIGALILALFGSNSLISKLMEKLL